MKKAYVITLDNGLSYDDNEQKPVAVAKTRKQADKWIRDNSPVTIEAYMNAFHYSIQTYMHNIEYNIVEVAVIEGAL